MPVPLVVSGDVWGCERVIDVPRKSNAIVKLVLTRKGTSFILRWSPRLVLRWPLCIEPFSFLGFQQERENELNWKSCGK